MPGTPVSKLEMVGETKETGSKVACIHYHGRIRTPWGCLSNRYRKGRIL